MRARVIGNRFILGNVVDLSGGSRRKEKRTSEGAMSKFTMRVAIIVLATALSATAYAAQRGGSAGVSGYSGGHGVSGYSGSHGVSGYSGGHGVSGYSGSHGVSGYSGSGGHRL